MQAVTVSVCGRPAGAIETAAGTRAIFYALWVPDMRHFMPALGESQYVIAYDPTGRRITAVGMVDRNGRWAARPVRVEDRAAVVDTAAGVKGLPTLRHALEGLEATP